jgi:prevent-host-death family protein
VATIPQKELRNNVSDVLRRAEAGEELTVTVAGRPVARLGPVRPRQWVRGPELQRIWQTPAPETLDADLARLRAEIADVFDR